MYFYGGKCYQLSETSYKSGGFEVDRKVILLLLVFIGVFLSAAFQIYRCPVQPTPSENGLEENVVETQEGWFQSGQEADMVLNWYGFTAGGPLSFNHPANIATDGKHLLLADTWNNRVLIWNTLPEGNVLPDLVLGQTDFDSNEPGVGPDKLNWPVGVTTDGTRVIVADTNNNRILIWSEFPTENAEPADLVLGAPDLYTVGERPDPIPLDWEKTYLFWPWAVWTDGTRLVATSTRDGRVLIWNSFPAENCQPADILLTAEGNFGTPRAIGSNGTCLIIGDHNSKVNDQGGDFVWNSFPSEDDEAYDFFITDPVNPGNVIWGLAFTSGGKMLGLAGPSLMVWNEPPKNPEDEPDLILDFELEWGDGGGIAVADGRVYLSLPNGHRILGFNSVPSSADQIPDFCIGSSTIYENPYEVNSFIGNPVVMSDGEHLFAISDFSRKMCVWNTLPDENGRSPDSVYELDFQPWDIAIHDGTLVVGGEDKIHVWNELPLNGEAPDFTLGPEVGGVRFTSVGGVELDDKYFYVADQMEGKLYVWNGIPDSSAEPICTVEVSSGVSRLSSNGAKLATISAGSEILIFSIEGIPKNEPPMRLAEIGISLNLPMHAFLHGDNLFVADTCNNRVLIWNRIPEEEHQSPDLVLGQENLEGTYPRTSKDGLYMPGSLCFDGKYLWVGEFKFSNRILRFTPRF